MIDLQIHERSYCTCDKCKLICKKVPGILAPGEVERIISRIDDEIDVTDINEVADWAADFFTTDKRFGGIPVIVPIAPCKFFNTLTETCGIHSFAPFGCRVTNACVDGAEYRNEAFRSLMRNIRDDPDYAMLWSKIRCIQKDKGGT